MGRTTTLTNVAPATMKFIAGEAISAGDQIQVSDVVPKALKVVNNRVASAYTQMTPGTAQGGQASGQILGQTTLAAGVLPSTCHRPTPVQDSSGNIYIAGNQSAATGVTLFKYDTLGVFLKSLVITSAAYASIRKLAILSSGNLLIVYQESASLLKFQIVDTTLSVVVAATSITGGLGNTGGWDAITLTGGGFSVVYNGNAEVANTDRLVTYNNSGSVTTGPVTINTRSGTSGNQKYALAQLSNGNIAVAQHSDNTAASIGGYYSVITTTGSVIKSFTQVSGATASPVNWLPRVVSITGYFCVYIYTGNSSTVLAVYDNAGTVQGSARTVKGSAPMYYNDSALITDGTYFYLVNVTNASQSLAVFRIDSGGGPLVSSLAMLTPTDIYGGDIDAFYDATVNGIVVIGYGTGNTQNFTFIDAASMQSIYSSATAIGSASGTSSGIPSLLNLKDGAFVCHWSYTSLDIFAIGKWCRTAIVGVARTSASAGGTVEVLVGAGSYPSNTVLGFNGQAFDHTTTSNRTVFGNKGISFVNNLRLGGM